MTGESDTDHGATWRTVWEIAAVVAVFVAAAVWPVPDVNEAVYLTKARHAADPAWAAGDFFLETPDAHGVFYLLFGPLAAAFPLEQAAWIGRVFGWLAVAVGFRHAVAPVVATTWGRVVAAALFSLALRHTTMAGEWVLGGCEAKVFAWAFVFGGVGEWLRGRFATAWLLCGAATAWHPIVGGWALVALVVAFAIRPTPLVGAGNVVLLVVGLALAASGVVPALSLSAGADAATRAAAAKIYVVERLNHHLLPRTFAEAVVARHLLAVAVWWIVYRIAPSTAARQRFAAFTLGALAISGAGVAISLVETFAPTIAFGLLRFYWFRLADVIVPLALAASVAAVLENDAASARAFGLAPRILRLAMTVLLILDVAAQSTHWPLPGRTALAARADAKVDTAAWDDVCAWVRDHAPADACFLTPRGSASFTWRTNRREVVSWKNSPQDAASLVAWRNRITDCFAPRTSLAGMEQSTAALGPERVQLVADRYGATHAIVPLDAPRLVEMPGERLYDNGIYAVYRLPHTSDSEPR
ncbi:MAG: DUF6798 domain-containing protein [Planctomycetia bacterium]